MKTEEVTSVCTMLCGRAGASKSFAKTVLVKVYPRGNPEKAISVYAIIDEQINRSLARSAFLDFLVSLDLKCLTLYHRAQEIQLSMAEDV